MIGAADSARSRSAPGAPSATTRQPDWTDVLRLGAQTQSTRLLALRRGHRRERSQRQRSGCQSDRDLAHKPPFRLLAHLPATRASTTKCPPGRKKQGRPEAALLQVKYVVAVCSARDALAAPPARAPGAAGKQARSAGDVLDRRRVARLRAQGRRARRLGLGAGGQGERANNKGCSRKRDRELEHRDFLR